MSDLLKVSLFPELTLENPIWIASAYLSDSENSLRNWIKIRPSAITLKTTAETGRKRETGVGKVRVPIQTHRDSFSRKERGQSSPNLYCDGEPREEYLSLLRTAQLLQFSRANLPFTKIGVSVMMGEDYSQACDVLKEADFAELNLKYAARFAQGEEDSSYFEAHSIRFDEILKETHSFCEAFSTLPIFIKLTRELPWLNHGKECQRFVDTILEQRKFGRRVGLVLANTRKLRVPADLVTDLHKDRYPGELAGGILAGEYLYIETYNLIRNLMATYRELGSASVPIIATGGITTLSSLLEAIHAGAHCVQMFTAFATYGVDYYESFEENLETLIKEANLTSYKDLVSFMQNESDQRLKALRFYALDIPSRHREALRSRLEEDRIRWLRAIAQQLGFEMSHTYSDGGLDQGMTADGCNIRCASQIDLPLLNSDDGTDLQQVKNNLVRVRIASSRASFSGHILINLLSHNNSSYQQEHFPSTAGVVRRINSGEDWDLAILTEAYMGELCNGHQEGPCSPIILGHLVSSPYHLCSFSRNLKDVKEIYSFGGRESLFILERLRQNGVVSESVGQTAVRTDEILFWLRHRRTTIGFLARDPLCEIYLAVAEGKMFRLRNVDMKFYLLGSERFCKSVGAYGLKQIYNDVRTSKVAAETLEMDKELRGLLETEIQEIWKTYLKI